MILHTVNKSPLQNNSLDACNPKLNATVSASAGSGKTWLLITGIDAVIDNLLCEVIRTVRVGIHARSLLNRLETC